MVSVKFNKKRLEKAIEKYGNKVVKSFAASTYKEIKIASPQKDTFSESKKYRRTGTLVEGWDIKNNDGESIIENETKYAIYHEYGHRTESGGIVKGAFIVATAVENNLKKFGLKAVYKVDL